EPRGELRLPEPRRFAYDRGEAVATRFARVHVGADVRRNGLACAHLVEEEVRDAVVGAVVEIRHGACSWLRRRSRLRSRSVATWRREHPSRSAISAWVMPSTWR